MGLSVWTDPRSISRGRCRWRANRNTWGLPCAWAISAVERGKNMTDSIKNSNDKQAQHHMGRREFVSSTSLGVLVAASGCGSSAPGSAGSSGESSGGMAGTSGSSGIDGTSSGFSGSSGGSTGLDETSTTGGPPAFDVTITVTREEGIAPAGFMFSAEVNGADVDRPFHDLRYKWTFSDPGNYNRLPDDLPWGTDRNIAYGPVVAHAYGASGSFEVVCEVTDGTNTVRASRVVILRDPDDVFSGSNTVCVSLAGDFADAPAGAMTATSLAAILGDLQRTDPLRLLFRSGEDFAEPIGFIAEFDIVQIGAYGDGPPPILRTGINFRNCTGELSVWGIDFVAAYNPSQPETTSPPSGSALTLNSDVHCTIHDCLISGWSIGIRPGDERLLSLVVGNTAVRDWFNFGLLQGGGGWVGLAGVSMRQHPMTERASGKGEVEPPFHADHGPFRLSRPSAPVCMNLVDLFTTNTWAGALTTMQPVIRWNAGGVQESQRLVIDRLRSEGGRLALNVSSSGARAGSMEIILDKFHHITTVSPTTAMSLGFGGTTVRNGVLVQPDVFPESSTGLRSMIGLTPTDPLRSYAEQPIEVYSCAIVDLRGTSNAVNQSGTPRDFSPTEQRPEGEYYFANNLLYAPDAITPETSALPLDLTPRWDPRYPGRNVVGEPFDDQYANPPSTASLFAATRRSSAAGAASGKVAIDDFFGNLRPDAPSLGATEPL